MSIDLTVVGGGMIVHDQILPSLYHMQRLGAVGDIRIVATRTTRLKQLVNPTFDAAFPGQSFKSFPDLNEDESKTFPDLYKKVVRETPRRSLIILATPEHLHHEMLLNILEADQHVLVVKPLTTTYAHAAEIERIAKHYGLFVGVEYHKRFDRRALEARRSYREGRFGQFMCGEAKLIEPWSYRHSNFANWFTCENTDSFTYIGCHYVDQVHFITGLRPVEVAVRGVKRAFPNGNVGYLWTAGQVVWENDAILSVINGLGYPDEGAGPNDQGMCLFCEGEEAGAVIRHADQFRGVEHGYIDSPNGAKKFAYINPDYFRLVPWTGEGLKPVGYGYESIEASVLAASSINALTANLPDDKALTERRRLLEEIDAQGIIATPANSSINELVVEAARLSVTNDGRRVKIEYGDEPRVKMS